MQALETKLGVWENPAKYGTDMAVLFSYDGELHLRQDDSGFTITSDLMLFMFLRMFRGGLYVDRVADLFGLSPSTCRTWYWHALHAILWVLNYEVRWPSREERRVHAGIMEQ